MSERKIIVNQMRTPDGTLLVSRHQHDFVSYIDQNGETYFTDGGDAYLRRSINKIPAEDLTIYDDAPFEVIREHVSWGTFGKNGDQPLHFIALKDMEDAHIRAVLETQNPRPRLRKYMLQEQEYRKACND